MSEWVIPVEEETGVPLAIEPHENLAPPGTRNANADWHHLIYPKSRHELKTVSGQAMRQVRLEWMDLDDHSAHHHYFNDYIVNQWEFPKTIGQRFGIVVLMAAGYIPENAIQLRKTGPEYVKLGKHERRQYWDRGLIKIASEWHVAKFIKEHVLSQDIVGVEDAETDIDMLLNSNDETERNQAGDNLLAMAAEIATEDVRDKYISVYRRRLILPDMPSEPKDIMFDQRIALGTAKRMRKARSELRNKLAKQLDVQLEAA